MSKKSGLNYKQTFLIGFGFMSCMLLWSIYNSYVPVMLKDNLDIVFSKNSTASRFIENHSYLKWISVPLIVNIIMTIDNIFGVIFQPLFGKKSDKTKSKFGKRMPYVIIGLPVCAVLFSLIPKMSSYQGAMAIGLMMMVIIAFNFVMSTWRSPVVSIMPDFTPTQLQSDGNAIINLTGGIGQMLGFAIGSIVSILGFKKSIDAGDYTSIFIAGSIFALLCLVVLVLFFKKNAHKDLSMKQAEVEEKSENAQTDKKVKLRNLDMPKDKKKSLYWTILALFLFSNGTEAIIPNFTNFARETLNLEPKYSTLMMAVFAVSLILFAVPSGIMGRKIGKKKTICIGLCTVVTMFLIYIVFAIFIKNDKFTWIMLWVALVVGGSSIAMVNINTLPIVLAMGGRDLVGTFTGYYYTATFSAAVTGPILCGLLIGLFKNNYNYLFLFCAIVFSLGLICMLQVKHGESSAEDEKWLEEAVNNAD